MLSPPLLAYLADSSIVALSLQVFRAMIVPIADILLPLERSVDPNAEALAVRHNASFAASEQHRNSGPVYALA